MPETWSPMAALLAGCLATAGCAVSPSGPSDVHASGDLSRLQDARFAQDFVRAGVWMPWKFEQAAGEGIYFLENHDDSKIPVLFIHGMYGSPRDFRYLIQHLDRSHFQPWLYYYPSGESLTGIAARLLHEIETLCTYYEVRSIVIVAHSMGGLIARDVLLHQSRVHGTAVPVLITLSTPWNGHRAAAIGARIWPTAVRSWHDLGVGSAYIDALFETNAGLPKHLPAGTQHYLLASLGRSTNQGVDGSDEVVSVTSQLRDSALRDSYRIYRFKETHIGILNSAAVADSINGILATVPHRPR